MRSCAFILLTFLFLSADGQENRSFDGSGNNIDNPDWGAAHSRLVYETGMDYSDGVSEPAGADRPNPRLISDVVFDQPEFVESNLGISDFGWGFGQFIDHDITLVEDDFGDAMAIPVPECDAWFDPSCSGGASIRMLRSLSDPSTGTGEDNPRQVVNSITSFVDGSAVYGSDEARAAWLRTFEGGKLKTSVGGFLPFNTTNGQADGPVDPGAPFMLLEGVPPSRHFIAGDIRANEQPGLASFHTLFLREHNRLCDELAAAHPSWDDEQLYQRARKIVGALIQVVLYEEFLPALGVEIPEYSGFRDDVHPGILNAFSAAAYRLGHTLVNGQIVRLDDRGDSLIFGSIILKDAFFNPFIITEEGGIEPVFRGMAAQMQQRFDTDVVHALRNFLFGPPGSGGLDLVSINIQRGRERGMPDYNTLRNRAGLEPVSSWESITSDPELRHDLHTLYGSTDRIDGWVGMLSEDILPGKAIGELTHALLRMQFTRLRDGDRYYYENDPAFSPDERAELRSTRLSDIIRRNTSITRIQDDVFHAQPGLLTAVEIEPFEAIRSIDIQAFPNPVHRRLNVAFRSQASGTVRLALFDVSGKVFLDKQLTVVGGDNHFEFDLDARYTAGVYTIRLTAEDGRGSLRLIKQ